MQYSPVQHCRYEGATKIRLRFVVGHIADPDSQAILEEEQRVHGDFHVLPIQETYDNLVLKVIDNHFSSSGQCSQ